MTPAEYLESRDRGPRGLLYPHGGGIFRISPAAAVVRAGTVAPRRPWESAADSRRRARLAMHGRAAEDARTRERLDRHQTDAEHDRIVARLRGMRA